MPSSGNLHERSEKKQKNNKNPTLAHQSVQSFNNTKFESSNTVANCEKVFYFKLDNFAARYRGEFATDLSQA